MNILNMCVLQCILCASERKFFRIYGALQIKVIIIIIIIIICTAEISIYERQREILTFYISTVYLRCKNTLNFVVHSSIYIYMFSAICLHLFSR